MRHNNLDFCYFCAIFQKFSKPSPVLTYGRIFRQKRMRHTAAISSDRLFSIVIELAGKERKVAQSKGSIKKKDEIFFCKKIKIVYIKQFLQQI